MADNVVEAQVREIVARFTTDLEGLLDKVKADNAKLETRVRELQEELGKERESRLVEAAKAEQYRRDAQRMFAQEMAKSLDPKDWENLDLSRYTLTIKDMLAEVEKLQSDRMPTEDKPPYRVVYLEDVRIKLRACLKLLHERGFKKRETGGTPLVSRRSNASRSTWQR